MESKTRIERLLVSRVQIKVNCLNGQVGLKEAVKSISLDEVLFILLEFTLLALPGFMVRFQIFQVRKDIYTFIKVRKCLGSR